MRPTLRVLPIALAATLLLSACGDDPDAGDAGAAAEPTEEGDAAGGEATEEAEPEEAAEADVAVATTDLGDVLVDADGMTLYLFTQDSEGESNCYEDCESAWPPLTVDAEPAAGDGVDTALLGTTERDDGSLQVTYDGQPLYRWQGDEEPGDVTGQNVNEVWFAVSPDGEAITATASEEEEEDEGIGY